MEDLITHAPLLFDDGFTSVLREPPLPPAPSGEPKPRYDYGSSYTRSHTIPPRSQDGQDFTPTLPPRPGQSIHPSRRTNPQPPKSDIFEQPSISPVPTPQSVEAQLPDSRPHDVEADTPVPTVVNTLQDQEGSKAELEEVPSDWEENLADNIGVRSLRTPESFATAESSRWGSPETGNKSKPSSRPSTAGSLPATARAPHDSA